jgi:glycosyltransferase involved in cell wall biosynthesis
MKELVQLGHEVTLIGHAESKVDQIGVDLIARTEDDWREQIPDGVDLIHLFYTPSFELPCPSLVTIEGNGQPGESFQENTVFVSRKHAEIHGATHFVYNGLDLSEYTFIERPDKTNFESLLFLAKASWKVKNLDDCIKAAKATNKKLHVAGGRAYSFSRLVKSHGMVDQQMKHELFKQTDALLWPVRWHEPFGIAMIEAMAQGLPVIGSTYGSLPEVIAPEVGYTCKNYDEFEKAIADNHQFKREKIRSYVEEKFSAQVMAQNYLTYYQKVIDGDTLHKQRPQVVSDLGPEELLPF